MMITNHEELARQRVAEQLRAAEVHAIRREDRAQRRAARPAGPRYELAGILRRLSVAR